MADALCARCERTRFRWMGSGGELASCGRQGAGPDPILMRSPHREHGNALRRNPQRNLKRLSSTAANGPIMTRRVVCPSASWSSKGDGSRLEWLSVCGALGGRPFRALMPCNANAPRSRIRSAPAFLFPTTPFPSSRVVWCSAYASGGASVAAGVLDYSRSVANQQQASVAID